MKNNELFTIESIVIDKGNYLILTISKVYIAEGDPQDCLVEFGKRFRSDDEIEAFKKTRFFKATYQAACIDPNL